MRFAQYFPNGAALHHAVPREQQKQLIRAFRNGNLDTLLTVDKFNEGIDIPDANQLVFLRSTQSRAIFLQQLGRGMRKTPGKPTVDVLDFVANCDRLAQVNDLWREITASAYHSHDTHDDRPSAVAVAKPHFMVNHRDIQAVLTEIEDIAQRYLRWTEEDSVALYRHLYEELGRHPGHQELKDYARDNPALPSIVTILAAFDQKIGVLRQASGLYDETLTTLNEFARANGMSYKSAKNLLEATRGDPKYVRTGPKGSYLAVDDATVRAMLEMALPVITEEEIGISDAAESLGCGVHTVYELVKSLGLERKEVRGHHSGRHATVLKRQDLERLRSAIPQSSNTPPPGVMSITKLAKVCGMDPKTLLRMAAEQGIEPGYHNFSGKATHSFTEEQADVLSKLPEAQVAPPPLGFESIAQLAARVGITEKLARAWLDEYGVERHIYRRGSVRAECVDADAVELIELLTQEYLAQPGMPEAVSINNLGRMLGRKQLAQTLGQLMLEPQTFKFGTRRAMGLSKEHARRVIEALGDDPARHLL